MAPNFAPITSRARNNRAGIRSPREYAILLRFGAYLSFRTRSVLKGPIMPKLTTATGADCNHRTNLPLVESSTFVDLLANLGEETTRKLLQEFLEDTGQRCQRLATALDANDRVTVSNEAHSVKGAAASFGAARLCKIASDLEREAANGSIKQLRALTTALKIAEQPTAEEFKRRLAGL